MSWPGARYACPGHPRFAGLRKDGWDETGHDVRALKWVNLLADWYYTIPQKD
jgi:hypothetical protein